MSLASSISRACRRRRGRYGGGQSGSGRARRGAGAGPGAAADAPARRTVRAAVGLRRRCALALRRRATRRRPYRAVSGDASGFAFAGLQAGSGPVRRAIGRELHARRGLACPCENVFVRPPATRCERRGSTGPIGPTARSSRPTSRSDTRHAISVLQAWKGHRRNLRPEG